ARVSDGPVKWEHGRGWSGIALVPDSVYPHRWSSAHEAAVEITRLTLTMLVEPLANITDQKERRDIAGRLLAEQWKALEIGLNEVADLQERIRRERARVLLDE